MDLSYIFQDTHTIYCSLLLTSYRKHLYQV